MKQFFEISGLNIYMQIIVTIVSILVHLYLTRNKSRKESIFELIAIYTIGLSGWFAMMSGAMGHILFADQVAQSIGWPINSGFQTELAFAAIGIGLIGFMGFWIRSFWLPYIITRTFFLWGAGLTHIMHMIKNQNFSPSNTGIVVYWDFILPILLIALFLKVSSEKKQLKRVNPTGE